MLYLIDFVTGLILGGLCLCVLQWLRRRRALKKAKNKKKKCPASFPRVVVYTDNSTGDPDYVKPRLH